MFIFILFLQESVKYNFDKHEFVIMNVLMDPARQTFGLSDDLFLLKDL